MGKGLEWYIEESKNNEENYEYHDLMTLMEQEFNINLWHYKDWKKNNPEIAKVYEEISDMRDKKYF